jgi:hypothetical protein
MSAQIESSTHSVGHYVKLFGENERAASLAIDQAEQLVDQKTKGIHTGFNTRVPRLKKQYAETLQDRQRTVADVCQAVSSRVAESVSIFFKYLFRRKQLEER